MAHPQIAVFARSANGNAKPTRAIAGQNTHITRSLHDMAYNPLRDEIVVPQIMAQAIMTFRGDASGDEAPIRVIMGPDTKIKEPQRLALDPVHQEIFVPSLGVNSAEISAFPSLGNGNMAPIRVLKGPDTQLGANALAVDPIHNLLVVAGNSMVGGKRSGHILIFKRTDAGNVKPLAVIRGPKTMLSDRDGDMLLAVYPPREWIVMGAPGAIRNDPTSFVGVWSEHDDGDVAPRWTIGGPNGLLRQTRGVALDPKHKTLIVGDKYLNAVMTFSLPEIF